MSTGGIFTLLNNEGKQDRLIMATDYLHERVSRIRTLRQAEGKSGADLDPTLAEIEKTHIFFMNAHFKPFVACSFEYSRVQASSGNVNLSSTVTFNLVNFGDFFGDMALHFRLGAVTSTNSTDLFRWCAYPGERLLETTRFAVHSSVLDDVKTEDYQFERKFMLSKDKVAGYNRCAGQQVLQDCQVLPGLDNSVGGVSTGLCKMGASVTGISGVSSLFMQVGNGYQTVKSLAKHQSQGLTGVAGTGWYHQRTDILEVTMPLLFWFNKDIRLALPAMLIPSGQRFVEVDLASLASLVQGVPVDAVDYDSANSLTDGANTVTASSGLSITGTEITHARLYVNNLFVDPVVHDIYIKNVGFNLIRVHKRFLANQQSASNEYVQLSSLKWPVETIFFGFKKTLQTTAAASLLYLDGYEMFSDVRPVHTSMALAPQTLEDGVLATALSNYLSVQWNSMAPLVSKVSFEAHSIKLYDEIPAIFYNSYFPLKFGSGSNIVTPSDIGVYAVFFNLYPGSYQPSGHINISRAREFYIRFDNAISSNERNISPNPVSSSDPVNLHANAIAINFLLLADGSAILRYTT
jgi:hypothetical protein